MTEHYGTARIGAWYNWQPVESQSSNSTGYQLHTMSSAAAVAVFLERNRPLLSFKSKLKVASNTADGDEALRPQEKKTDDDADTITPRVVRAPRLRQELRSFASIPFELARAFNTGNPHLFTTILNNYCSPTCAFIIEPLGREPEHYPHVVVMAGKFCRLLELHPDGVMETLSATALTLPHLTRDRFRRQRVALKFTGTRIEALGSKEYFVDPTLPAEKQQSARDSIAIAQEQVTLGIPISKRKLLRFTLEMTWHLVQDRTEGRIVSFKNSYRIIDIEITDQYINGT